MISLHGSFTSKIDRLDPRFLEILKASARLARKDPTLWGSDAEQDANVRLN